MGVLRKEQINPAVPSKERVLVLLDKGGQNWYMRIRSSGRYRYVSLATPDLDQARRKAYINPPEPNEKQGLSIKRALSDFQESRQQLLDAPGDTKSIRLNTFKAYKARIASLIKYFEQKRVLDKDRRVRGVGSLKEADFSAYHSWREIQGAMQSTIKTEISQINSILSWFYENQYINNPIKLKLPKYDPDKYRKPNRLLTDEEDRILRITLKRLCNSGDDEKDRRWNLYHLWLQWLEDTFARPHEARQLCLHDVKEFIIEGRIAVQYYTKPGTKTGERLVYVISSVKKHLITLYESWGLSITDSSPLFLLPSGTPPSSSWYSEQWKKLVNECGFKCKPRELTQYSLRHQGINTLLVQGVATTKVADLAGHSLAIQQAIYKKYSLENDHSVLRTDNRRSRHQKQVICTADLPEPWEISPETGEWFDERE